MSLWRSFRALSKRTRLTIGLGVLAWGTIGLYVSDAAEKKLGFEASGKERDALREVMPSIVVIEKDK